MGDMGSSWLLSGVALLKDVVSGLYNMAQLQSNADL